MARQTHDDADVMFREGRWRSCVSRAYYAGFQAATALLHQSGQVTPPIVDGEQREAWAHKVTPDIMKQHLSSIIQPRAYLNQLASNLGLLYKFRIQADYHSEKRINNTELKEAIRCAGILVKTAENIVG